MPALRVHGAIAVTLAVTDKREPPTEFRIFRAGENASTKGTVLFDEESARSVLAEYEAHGIDLPIDWDHAMVDRDSRVEDRRAAGWFKLEVRKGELWAVDVRWVPEAQAKLRAGEWRFMSPAFLFETDSGRVIELVNVAICNLPATRQLDALVAASKDVGATPRNTPATSAGQETPMTTTILLATMAASLGLAASATEAEVLSITAKRGANERELLTLTGASTFDEARGILVAWKESHGKVAKIEADEKARAEAEKTAKHAALMKQGRESGKITGATEAYWAGQPVESLDGYLKVATTALPEARANADKAPTAAKEWSAMTTMEQHRMLNDDPETAKALRAASKKASLAMPIKNTDVIDRELLEQSIRGAVAAGVVALYGTGAAVVKTTLAKGEGSEGDVVKVPYFGGIGEFEVLATDGDALTPKPFASTSETATVVHAGIAFEMTAWAAAGVDDPYGEVARQCKESLIRHIDKTLIDAALTSDIPMTNTTGASFSYDAFVDTKMKFADEQDELACMVVNSKVMGVMLKMKDANNLPLLIDVREGAQQISLLGVPIKVSDRLTPTVGVNNSLLLKKNSLVFWMNGDVTMKTDADILKNTKLGAIHVYAAAHKYKRLPGLTKPGVAILKTTEA